MLGFADKHVYSFQMTFPLQGYIQREPEQQIKKPHFRCCRHVPTRIREQWDCRLYTELLDKD